MKLSAFAFLACLLAPLCSINGKPAFTTADVLLVRQHASRNSQVLGLIPYGTQVDHDPKIWPGDGLAWVWLPALNGYVAFAYLSESEPPFAAKSLDLGSEMNGVTCNGSGHSTSMRLRLANGSFAYLAGPRALGINTYQQGSGTYTIGRHSSIILTVLRLVETPTWTPVIPILPKPLAGKFSMQIKIVYAPEFSGFFLDKDRTDAEYLFPVVSLKYAQAQDPASRKGCTFHLGDCEKPGYGFETHRGFLCINSPK